MITWEELLIGYLDGDCFVGSLQNFAKSSRTCSLFAYRNCQALPLQIKWMHGNIIFDIAPKIRMYKEYFTQNKSGSSCSDIKLNVETKIFAVLSCVPHTVDSEIKWKLCSVLIIKAESVHE